MTIKERPKFYIIDSLGKKRKIVSCSQCGFAEFQWIWRVRFFTCGDNKKQLTYYYRNKGKFVYLFPPKDGCPKEIKESKDELQK
jgi:ribosomal protein S27AE